MKPRTSAEGDYMKKLLEKMDDKTLWSLLEDMTPVVKQPDKSERFLFWHTIYKAIRSEIDKRLERDFEK